MKVAKPLEITPLKLIESNVPTDDYPIYDPLVEYTQGDRVVLDRKVYEVVSEVPVTGVSPIDNTILPVWLEIGYINRWRAFDKIVGTFTSGNYPFDVNLYNVDAVDPLFDTTGSYSNGVAFRLRTDEVNDTLALFNLRGLYVDIVVRTSDGVVYRRRVELGGTLSTSDWYSYFYQPLYRQDRVILTDIPSTAEKDIYISIVQPSGEFDPHIGEIVIGNSVEIGKTMYGVGLGFLDFSTKERDQFGNFTIVERGYADQLDIDLSIKNTEIPYLRQLIADLRLTPCVWIASECVDGTAVYGYLSSFNIVISGPERSDVSVRVEGLI